MRNTFRPSAVQRTAIASRFSRLVVAFACLFGVFSATACLGEELSGKLESAVRPYVERQELAGAVMLVANREQILAHAAVGWSDVQAQQPMRTDAVFWIASQSKPITAVALMMLVDAGQVKLDDPVEKYLPDFHGQLVVEERTDERLLLRKPVKAITVRQVLSHTSGLPFKSAIEQPTLDRFPLADRVRSYSIGPLDFQPDTKYQYSNAGINTAGRIIEVVSGQSFEQFLDQRLLQPLGMIDTTFWPNAAQVERLAKAYQPGPQGKGLAATTINQLYYPLSDRTQRFAMPAGGLFSTAADLARFYQMLARGGEWEGKRYLSADAVRQLTSRQTPLALPTSYGLGFSTSEERFGHGGAYSTNSYWDAKRELIFIWLVQHAGFAGKGGESQEAFRQAVLANTSAK